MSVSKASMQESMVAHYVGVSVRTLLLVLFVSPGPPV